MSAFKVWGAEHPIEIHTETRDLVDHMGGMRPTTVVTRQDYTIYGCPVVDRQKDYAHDTEIWKIDIGVKPVEIGGTVIDRPGDLVEKQYRYAHLRVDYDLLDSRLNRESGAKWDEVRKGLREARARMVERILFKGSPPEEFFNPEDRRVLDKALENQRREQAEALDRKLTEEAEQIVEREQLEANPIYGAF